LYAPLDANVWRVNVEDGSIVSSAQPVAILEAMKMEVSVSYNADQKDSIDQSFKIEKVIVHPGDTVKAGDALAFLRNI
jgi:biotin carboxyl carrier protein